MDKYIIDGVEYSYGEEVEVRNDGDWCKNVNLFIRKQTNTCKSG